MQTEGTFLANNMQQCCNFLRPFAWALKVPNMYEMAMPDMVFNA